MNKNILFISVAILLHCNFTPGIFNPEHPDYTSPTFTADSSATTMWNGDTIDNDTVLLALAGNYDIVRFRWRLDSAKWSAWERQHKSLWTPSISGFGGGAHRLHIQACYNPDSEISDSILEFYRVSHPTVKSNENRIIIPSQNDSEALHQPATDTDSITVIIKTNDTFVVVFFGNGNNRGDSLCKFMHPKGFPINLAESCKPEREGYSLNGWNELPSGNGVHYDVKAPIGDIQTDTLRLFAEWKKNICRIIYTGNGNTSGKLLDTVTYEYGEPVVIAGNNSVFRASYSFAGWNDAAKGKGTWYRDGDTFTIVTSDMTLFAQWLPSGMTVLSAKGKSFLMGQDGIETPVRKVTFTYDFWIDTTEVTQGQYDKIMRQIYSTYISRTSGGETFPVNNIGWYDAVVYCNARTKASGNSDTVYRYESLLGTPGNNCNLAGLLINRNSHGWRLPNEAEWEFACRAGTTSTYYWGNDAAKIGVHAWFKHNSSGRIHPVASKSPNAWGLYDMFGNVWEMCNDWFDEYPPGQLEVVDPIGPSQGRGFEKVLRGSSFEQDETYLSAAARGITHTTLPCEQFGFRCVLQVHE